MGSSSSSLTGFQQCLNQLSQNDYSDDPNFWKEIFQQTTDLNDAILWYPNLLSKIATNQPGNMIKLISVCVYNIDNICTDESKISVSAQQLNILCQVFTSSCSVVLSNQQFSSLFQSVKTLITSFLISAIKCLNIQNLTGMSSTSKSTNKSIRYIKARYDLIHALLCSVNFNYFTRFIENPPLLELSIPDFPSPFFFKMLCELSDKVEVESTLFKNCIALSTKFGSQISSSITSVDPMIFYKYFINNNFDQYGLILFFQCSLYNKQFIEQMFENSTLFLFKILNFSMLRLEEGGISFIHTITVNTIQLILENKNSLSHMNDQFNYKFTTKFQPQQSERLTFTDVTIEVLFNICNSPSLIPNFTQVFKQLSLNVKELSLFCSMKSIELFSISSQNLTKDDSNKIFLTESFLEAFANILQRPDQNEYFRIVMAQQAGSFMFLKQVTALESPAIDIITKYLAAIRQKVLKINRTKVDIAGIDNIVRNLDTKEIFPEVLKFEVPKLKFDGKLESSWSEWSEVLFLQCFRTELERIKQNDLPSAR
ncbi:hypothetical protein M9Y10_034728 [Tritrichomonas musculus]|uniref:Dymeclin n=1 Tax=Tritrichomonas musculus TaxID=1915356 RepID=A0ABR2KGU9_9EUKA